MKEDLARLKKEPERLLSDAQLQYFQQEYDRLMALGKHGHYESMFKVFELAAWAGSLEYQKRSSMSAHTYEELRQMLFDVVDELDLSDGMLDEHGPLGTAPAKLVRLVLERKDRTIAMLRQGFVDVSATQPKEAREK